VAMKVCLSGPLCCCSVLCVSESETSLCPSDCMYILFCVLFMCGWFCITLVTLPTFVLCSFVVYWVVWLLSSIFLLFQSVVLFVVTCLLLLSYVSNCTE